jgi:hypothetical protein
MLQLTMDSIRVCRLNAACSIHVTWMSHALSQAAAIEHMTGKPDVFEAAQSGNLSLLNSHVIVNPECVKQCDGRQANVFTRYNNTDNH